MCNLYHQALFKAKRGDVNFCLWPELFECACSEAGYHIPQGSQVIMSPFWQHRDTAQWGAQGLALSAERGLGFRLQASVFRVEGA